MSKILSNPSPIFQLPWTDHAYEKSRKILRPSHNLIIIITTTTITRAQKKKTELQAYLSNASRYFCFRISKNIFIEYRLSSTLVKPERYFSTSSQLPLCTSSSKYFMLKKNPDSCSSLFYLLIYFHITSHYTKNEPIISHH